MKKLKKLLSLILCASLVCALMFVATPTASADAAEDAAATALAAAINASHGDGGTALVATPDGPNVNVSGTYRGPTRLTLDIPAGVTVNWAAQYTVSGGNEGIRLQGAGRFNLRSGAYVDMSDGNSGPSGIAIDIHGNNEVDIQSGSMVMVAARTGQVHTGIMMHTTYNPTVNISGLVQVNGDNSTGVRLGGSGRLNITDGGQVQVSGGGLAAGIAITSGSTDSVSIQVNTGGTMIASGTSTAISNNSNNANVTVTVGDGSIIAADGCTAIRNVKNGAVYINDTATVSATTGTAISNSAGGSININNTATVSATTGTAINNYGGAVHISYAATVIATTGTAINNGDSGIINVNATATVSAESGTAVKNDGGSVNIGGSATVSATTGAAIYNSTATSEVNVSESATVSATTGTAINNVVSGEVNVNDSAMVFAYGADVNEVVAGDYDRDGNAIILAWDKPTTAKTYTVYTDEDISVDPDTATAEWMIGGTAADNGISYSKGANTGIIKLGVTVGKATPTGVPTYEKITKAGQTLGDANLDIGTITPAGGTIAWDLDPTTEVERGVSYKWTYTPLAADANYTTLSDSIVPYPAATSGPGFGSSPTTGTEKPPETAETPATTAPADVDDAPAVEDFPFTDVLPSDWFYDDVVYVYVRDMMRGTSATEFSPQGKMSRAMVFTVLARLAGVETEGGETWYSLALAWGVETGLTDGSNPDGNVTREQLVTLLWRYAGSPSVETALDGFNDADSLSDWASDAMAWAVSVGIIRGNDDGSINPQGDATRAEVAAMLRRFVEAA